MHKNKIIYRCMRSEKNNEKERKERYRVGGEDAHVHGDDDQTRERVRKVNR